jgi:hypothetical protein
VCARATCSHEVHAGSDGDVQSCHAFHAHVWDHVVRLVDRHDVVDEVVTKQWMKPIHVDLGTPVAEGTADKTNLGGSARRA